MSGFQICAALSWDSVGGGGGRGEAVEGELPIEVAYPLLKASSAATPPLLLYGSHGSH